ncbi:hypothetical protein EX895_001038 [Sporisorium graminicola]|uniref:Uncharacterized protein n=1 Tax=Sporisorium graminicola TaxID=280036 RepID=A0A4V6EUK9_9BASI|nr:hypothetical protein EX895_001038 [Sporisorium graminicola]TKY91039.1 hypothetical protein EX895_001038 [Sporisorium graminicola]
MSGFIAFLLLVSGMGVGTLVCGLAPLSLPLSHRMMRVLEVFGAGLLVGAAVTVVIPEGANALFANVTPQPPAHALTSAYANALHPPTALPLVAPIKLQPTDAQPPQESWAWSFVTKRSEEPSDDHDHAPDRGQHHGSEHTFTSSDAEHRLGGSILFGIVLMYVIDQLTSSSAGPSAEHSHDKAHGNMTPSQPHNHSNDYASTPVRPRLETHRLSKSFHHRPDPTAIPNSLHKVSSRASFTLFDRSQYIISQNDEEAQVGGAPRPEESDPHRRIESAAARSSSSDHGLPDDYDDHHPEHYHHADLKRVSSTIGNNSEWHSSPRSSTTFNRETPITDLSSTSAAAPLLQRHASFTSVNSGRPASKRRGSTSSAGIVQSTFGQALTTILGLLIHASADGIAMGASARSGDQTLTMVVFVAIMVHKAPAAFGLCAMLMSQRLSRTSIRKAVAVFALASPLGAVLTYGLLALFFDADGAMAHGSSGEGQGIDAKSIGTALAFSGGTFLFVAFHAVLELAGAEADTVPRQLGGDEAGEVQILGKWLRIVLLIVGACTPRMLQGVLATFGGSHEH